MNLLENLTAVGAARVETAENGVMIQAPAASVGAGVTLTFEDEARDWSAFQSLVFTLRANGAHRLRIHITHGDGVWTMYLVPRPGLTARVVLPFAELRERAPNTGYPGYSRFGGGPQPVALNAVHSLTLTLNQVSPQEKSLAVGDMLLSDEVPEPEVLDPCIVVDEYGQWIGKRAAVWSPLELSAAWQFESPTFTGFPGQTDAFGGAANLRMDEGTGFFRLARTGKRWHFVDPDGYAFFSLGCDCVRPMSEGPVGGREALFADLSHAQENTKGERASGGRRGRWDNPLWADFYQQNLRRRYETHGENWRDAWAADTVARLRSWGFNTIANWSDPDLTGRGWMPYVANVTSLGPLCGHLPDVYAPDFAARVRALVTPEVAPFRDDRMLIGWFVGNEPAWTFGGHRHPFNDVLVSPEYPHTREKAVAFVRATYGELAKVNAAWGASLKKWDDLTKPGRVPDVRLGPDALKRDADTFMGGVLYAFYDTACRELRQADPNHLLLGGRFYSPSLADPYLKACAPFDVFSFNRYDWEPNAAAIERIYELTGLPVLIGEFHYGVEGRGLTASLVATTSQEERGLAYRHFVEGLAALPTVLGAHWFQWVDQPVTGRFDGECYNIGLVDITDIPYTDFLAHVYETHTRVYDVHQGKTPPYVYKGQRPAAW